MKIEQTIFRRYDIRGKYPSELNEVVAYNIALTFANLFPKVKTLAVGGDHRRSTPALRQAFINGLVDGGKKITDLGLAITPLVYFAVCHYGLDGGMVITGSHLDATYNGIKIVLKNATPSAPADYDHIMRHILADKMVKAKTAGSVKTRDISQEYINYLISKIKLKKPLKIIIDTGNGAAGRLPEKIFKALGCQVETIFAEMDDTAPNHTPDPYRPENMQDLKNKVLESGADLGIGLDGDGDRASFVDKSGYILSGDDLLMLFTKEALSRRKGPIVADSRASLALIEEVENQGQEMILALGYHAAVLAKMIEKKAVFGGETTCHFYFPLDFYLTDDAVFAAAKLTMIAAAQDNFVKLVKDLPRYATSPEIFIDFPDTTKYHAVDRFTALAKKQKLKVNDIDGARIDYNNGWGIVRPSNTSPCIKVKFEGRTKADLIAIEKKMLELMEQASIAMSAENKKELGL